ncbi:hypothetical protein ROE7235_03749 [Roseibaca ekhonensis]|uniref:Uncharacterized protein n=1 Tax=Roseinatronobacter ekhonensis TaxID=254356 RepID=A0A3B0MKA0_9RHOB|nr:hypothetical protein [Roseibaca ekhonensis]SUZ33968.1 hypothetical protein ROE7235_03749 [Roseibaca ekhonensis]
MTQTTLTAICPEAMISDANNWAMIALDGLVHCATFDPPTYQREGSRFAVASFLVAPGWLDRATGTLTRPAWDVGHNRINETGANRASDALVTHEGTAGAPLAMPGTLLLILGVDARAALAATGLVQIPSEI